MDFIKKVNVSKTRTLLIEGKTLECFFSEYAVTVSG